jgi:hypothetical protein
MVKALLSAILFLITFILSAQHEHRIHSDSVDLAHLADPYNYQLNAFKRNRFFYNYEYKFSPLSWMDSRSFNRFSINDTVQLTSEGISDFHYDYGFNADHNFSARYSDQIENQFISGEYLSNRNFGDYNHSLYKVENFNFFTGNLTSNTRNHFQFISNSADLSENGGLWSLESLDASDGSDDVSIFTRLNTAENQVRETYASAGIGYFFDFIQDTLIDTTQSKINGMEIYLNSEYHKYGYLYTMDEGDIDSMFFSKTLFDSTLTRDSLGFVAVFVEPKLTYFNNKYQIGISYRLGRFENEQLNRDNINLNVTNSFGNCIVDGSFDYYTNGIWEGGLKSQVLFQKDSILGGRILLSGNFSSMLPEFPIQRFIGNHFLWDNSFKEEQRITVSVDLKTYENWQFELELNNLTNYIYFNENSIPVQSTNSIFVGRTTVSRLWRRKHFISANKMGMQYVNDDVIRIPAFYGTSTNAVVFKFWEMPTSIGAQLFYMTKHKGMAYNPNLRQFHLQNNQLVGGFPMLDLFFSLKAGNADLFVKGENLLFQFLPKSSFLLYEQMVTMPTFLRIGFHWKFIDN